nr:MAG TPA: General control protein GCN4 and CLUSTER, BENDABLE REGION, CONTRACTILE.6A [Caudoviricetes sp.]
MWKKTKCVSLVAVLLLCSCWWPAISYGEETTEQEVVMSADQFRTLKETSAKLRAELTLQEEKIKMLEKSSDGSTQELIELQGELTDCRNRLQQTESSLVKSEMAMSAAKTSLSNLNEHLETLKAKIKRLEHQQVIAKRQRDIWAAIAVVSLSRIVLSGL